MYQNIGKTHYDEKELLDLWENTKHYVYNTCHQQGFSAIAAFGSYLCFSNSNYL
jgi:hypothetical protein